MKKQSGVTALSLMIIIVIIILIASSSLLSSQDLIVEAKIETVYNEIETVKEAARRLKSLNEMDPKKYDLSQMLFTDKITDISVYNDRVGQKLVEGQEYYYLDFKKDVISDTMKASILESLDIKSVTNSYIINMKEIDNIEAFLVDGIKINDNTYYTYEEIAKEYSGAIQK